MVRLCGAALGFLAFSVAILLGLWSNNPFDVILIRALWAMVGFFALGLATGWVAWRVLDEHALKKARALEDEFRKAHADPTDQNPPPEADAPPPDQHDRSSDYSGDRDAGALREPAPAQ